MWYTAYLANLSIWSIDLKKKKGASKAKQVLRNKTDTPSHPPSFQTFPYAGEREELLLSKSTLIQSREASAKLIFGIPGSVFFSVWIVCSLSLCYFPKKHCAPRLLLFASLGLWSSVSHLFQAPSKVQRWYHDGLQKEMATHSSILAWKIAWTEEPGELQFTGSQSVGHDRATEHIRMGAEHLLKRGKLL